MPRYLMPGSTRTIVFYVADFFEREKNDEKIFLKQLQQFSINIDYLYRIYNVKLPSTS